MTTRPSMVELQRMSAAELTRVRNFAVVRENVAEIEWVGETDVTGLDLDAIVQLKYHEVVVYPNESVRPPPGEGLNKRAIVKLHEIWKKDRTSGVLLRDERAVSHMVEKLHKYSRRQGARFLDYDVGGGTWTFAVEHFDSDVGTRALRKRTLAEECANCACSALAAHVRDGRRKLAAAQKALHKLEDTMDDLHALHTRSGRV